MQMFSTRKISGGYANLKKQITGKDENNDISYALPALQWCFGD
jgi:hypothetical protein